MASRNKTLSILNQYKDTFAKRYRITADNREVVDKGCQLLAIRDALIAQIDAGLARVKGRFGAVEQVAIIGHFCLHRGSGASRIPGKFSVPVIADARLHRHHFS